MMVGETHQYKTLGAVPQRPTGLCEELAKGSSAHPGPVENSVRTAKIEAAQKQVYDETVAVG